MKPYYEDETTTIYCGDCRGVLPSLQGVDVLLTDSPYPNGEGYFLESIDAAREVLSAPPASSVFAFWSEIERPPCPLPLVAVHIFHRTNVNGKIYEPVYHFESDGRKRRSDVKGHAAVFGGVGPGCNEYLGHPNQKPLAIMRWLLGKSEGLVLDPFMGSGTTGLACAIEGRKFIGVEIDESYCEQAVARIKRAKLIPCDVPKLNRKPQAESPLFAMTAESL